jgi:endogenous inhibitor of DNA gyrase (YacG/DUF329 family)
VDLGAWASGSHAIPGDEITEDEMLDGRSDNEQ